MLDKILLSKLFKKKTDTGEANSSTISDASAVRASQREEETDSGEEAYDEHEEILEMASPTVLKTQKYTEIEYRDPAEGVNLSDGVALGDLDGYEGDLEPETSAKITNSRKKKTVAASQNLKAVDALKRFNARKTNVIRTENTPIQSTETESLVSKVMARTKQFKTFDELIAEDEENSRRAREQQPVEEVEIQAPPPPWTVEARHILTEFNNNQPSTSKMPSDCAMINQGPSCSKFFTGSLAPEPANTIKSTENIEINDFGHRENKMPKKPANKENWGFCEAPVDPETGWFRNESQQDHSSFGFNALPSLLDLLDLESNSSFPRASANREPHNCECMSVFKHRLSEEAPDELQREFERVAEEYEITFHFDVSAERYEPLAVEEPGRAEEPRTSQDTNMEQEMVGEVFGDIGHEVAGPTENDPTIEQVQNIDLVRRATRKLGRILRELPNLNFANSLDGARQWLRLEIDDALDDLNLFTGEVQVVDDGDSDLEEASSERSSHTASESDSEDWESDDEDALIDGPITAQVIRRFQREAAVLRTNQIRMQRQAEHEHDRTLAQVFRDMIQEAMNSGNHENVAALEALRPPGIYLPLVNEDEDARADSPDSNASVNFDTFDPAMEEEPVFDGIGSEDGDAEENEQPEEELNPEYEQDMRRIEQENMNVLAQWEDGLGEMLLEKMTCPICRDDENKIHFVCEECNKALCISCESQIEKFTDEYQDLKCPHCRATQSDREFRYIRFPRLQ